VSALSKERSLTLIIVFAGAALFNGCQTSAPDGASGDSPEVTGSEVEYLTTSEQEELALPFSEAVRVGSMLYLAGQVGNLPGALDVVEGGIVPETRQTMENIRAVLRRYGSSMDRVVKCTVMIDEIELWGAFNEVYVEFFPDHKPARSAFGADGLALGAAVEVECWATVD
jgi:2-iminobutanoate/2-iminopropanoate deaminase